MFCEGVILYSLKKIYFIEKKIGFFSYWNVFVLFQVIMGYLIIFMDFYDCSQSVYSDFQNALKVFHSFNLLTIWVIILGLSTFHEKTAFYMRVLVNILDSVKFFICIFMYILLGFSFSTYLLQHEYKKSRFFAFEAFYELTLGDFDHFNELSSQSKVTNFFWIIFFISTIVFMIIILNVLIAIVSNAYEKMLQKEKFAKNYEKACNVQLVEELIPAKYLNQLQEKEIFLPYLFVVTKKKVQQEDESLSENILKDINYFSKTLTDISSSMHRQSNLQLKNEYFKEDKKKKFKLKMYTMLEKIIESFQGQINEIKLRIKNIEERLILNSNK